MKKFGCQDMLVEMSNETFRANMISEIKSIQKALNELKTRKRGITKKSTKRKTARRTVKRKTARRTVKRKTSRRRQVPDKPNYLTNLCPNQYENS